MTCTIRDKKKGTNDPPKGCLWVECKGTGPAFGEKEDSSRWVLGPGGDLTSLLWIDWILAGYKPLLLGGRASLSALSSMEARANRGVHITR